MKQHLLKLIAMGDGYVILRGGTGTLLELAAVWEMMNKGTIGRKPIVTLGEFWNGVIGTLRAELMYEGRPESSEIVTITRTPAECRDILIDKLGVRYEA